MNVWIVALCLVLASSILVKGECEKESVEGVITAIDYDALEITLDDGTTVDAADADITIAIKKEQKEFAFEDMKIGMTVKACGTMVVDGLEEVLVADKINVRYGGATE